VQIGSTSQTGERRHDWRVIGCWLVAAGVRIGRDRRQRLSDNRSDRNRASWFDECGGGQDVVDQLFAPLINSRAVLALGHQRREVLEPLMVAPVGLVDPRCIDLGAGRAEEQLGRRGLHCVVQITGQNHGPVFAGTT